MKSPDEPPLCQVADGARLVAVKSPTGPEGTAASANSAPPVAAAAFRAACAAALAAVAVRAGEAPDVVVGPAPACADWPPTSICPLTWPRWTSLAEVFATGRQPAFPGVVSAHSGTDHNASRVAQSPP